MMGRKNERHTDVADRVIKNIRRQTRRRYSAEDNIRIVLTGLRGDLKEQIGKFISHYNHNRYHKSINNLTPVDVYFGHYQTILQQRERIKQDTFKLLRLQYRKKAAYYKLKMSQTLA